MNNYELKQEARKQRLLDRADRADIDSDNAYQSSHNATSSIPFGQPILVGHHSEARHRKAIEKSWSQMGKCVTLSKYADELRSKAASVGTGGISSDDPDALIKLREKLEKMVKSQEIMKAANKIIKSKKLSDDDKHDNLLKLGLGRFSSAQISNLLKPDFAGRIGFASYSLTNNNANMKTVKNRIIEMENKKKTIEKNNGENTEVEKNGIKLIQNLEENRIQLIFPDKPSAEIRGKLKSDGFRWAPSQNAWQRQLNNRSIYIAKSLFNQIAGE
jgi:hypothetical protein